MPELGLYASAMSRSSRVAQAVQSREDDAQPSHVRDLLMPAVLIVAGVMGTLALCPALMIDVRTAMVSALLILLIEALVFIPVVFGSLTVVAKWFDTGLGPLLTLLLKLAAITVGTGALADVLFIYLMLEGDPSIWLAASGYVVFLILCGVPLAFMLELGVHETATLTLMVYMPKLACLIALGAMQPRLFVS